MNSDQKVGFGQSWEFQRSMLMILPLVGLIVALAWTGRTDPNREQSQPVEIDGVKIAVVGEIVPNREGGYHPVRTIPVQHRSENDTLEVFVRRGFNGARWGYVYLGRGEDIARWQKISSKFRAVPAKNFMEIQYRPDFGPVRDPEKGFVTRAGNGSLIYEEPRRSFTPHWVVVEMLDPKEG